eukprot:140515-Chlamydomonas_euryale.AAC.1
MDFAVMSKKLSTVLEDATRPGVQILACTAAFARNAATQRQALARLKAAPTTPMSGVRVIQALEYLLAHGPLASRDCFANLGKRRGSCGMCAHAHAAHAHASHYSTC